MLQDLVRYYDILAKDTNSGICKLGYGEAKISYAINLSKDGELLNLLSLKVADSKGKKYVSVSKMVPEPVKKTVNVAANFLWDNSSYVFGIDDKGKPERSEKCFFEFKRLCLQVMQSVENEETKAMTQYLEQWEPKVAAECPQLQAYLEDIYGGANFIFHVEGMDHYIHENKEIMTAWERYKSQSQSEVQSICLVTGEKLPIARLHPIIKGIRGGQAMGNTLISYNDLAYESYGKEKAQGYNACISEKAAYEYSTVLNKLLSDNEHKIYIGDTTVLFWAESTQRVYQDVLINWLNPQASSMKEETMQSKSGNKDIKSILSHIRDGIARDEEIDEDISFCILGLAPNAARISVRFFIKDSFGEILKHLERHYQDMQLEKQFNDEMNLIPIWRMLSETVSKKSTNKDASPLLAGSVMRAILLGAKYPDILYQSILMRIRAEHDISYYKVSIIKACLIRKSHLSDIQRGGLTMALNKDCTNMAYILGRLFAILEKIQLDGVEAINTTIKDKYFNSACANPANIFPMLLKLSNHHLNRISDDGKRISSEKRLNEIMELITVDDEAVSFPKSLSYDDQGLFVIGYYHQRNDFYKKKEDK